MKGTFGNPGFRRFRQKKFDGGKRSRVDTRIDKEFAMTVNGRKVWMAGKTAREDYGIEY
jgi:hypothetical protein